jgi:hypothetical protein
LAFKGVGCWRAIGVDVFRHPNATNDHVPVDPQLLTQIGYARVAERRGVSFDLGPQTGFCLV